VAKRHTGRPTEQQEDHVRDNRASHRNDAEQHRRSEHGRLPEEQHSGEQMGERRLDRNTPIRARHRP